MVYHSHHINNNRVSSYVNNMGNSNPSKQPHKYTQLRIEQNQVLSSLMVVQDPASKQKLMVKQLTIASEQEYLRVLKELRGRKSASGKRVGQYLIQIKEIEARETSEICGKNYRITLYLEYLQGTLKTAFNERQRASLPFPEAEVIQLILTVVNCLIILHDNSYRNVHIYKQSIFRIEGGGYKLADTQLSNRIHPYFELLNNVPTKTGTYLAPELLAQIRANNTDFFHTPKADIFTLAILAMELLTLSPYDHYYDYDKMQVYLQGLRSAVQQLYCSQELKQVLHMMLLEEQSDRIGLLSLKELLSGSQGKSEDSALRSATASLPRKTPTRAFISRSKPTTKNNSIHKVQTEQTTKKEDKRINKDFPTQRQRKVEGMPLPYHYLSHHVLYRPVERVIVKEQPKVIAMPASHSVYEVRQTPRSSFQLDPRSQFTNRLKIRQFQTPINILYHPGGQQQPQSTPIRKIQLLNSLQQQSNAINQSNIPQKLINNNQTSSFSTDYPTSKNYGKHVFRNGAKYEGEFNSNNQFQGNGMLYYPCGKLCYSGSWKANSFHGFGVLYNQAPSSGPTNYQNFNFVDKNTWDHYDGEFNEDKKDGFGTLYFLNGDKFSGCFKDDAVQGFGTFFLAAEERNINGIWSQNELKR